MSIKLFLILFLVLGTSFFGAWLSVLVRRGHNCGLVYLSTFLSASIWLYVVKCSDLKLSTTSLSYDIIMSMGYLLGFIVLAKESISVIQWIGISLAFFSVILMNWKS